MNSPNITEEKSTIKHWYLPLILGIVLIVVGISVLLTPVASYYSLAALFSISFLITGILEITYAIVNRNQFEDWGWSLSGGILDLLFGLLLIATPILSIIILPFFVGFGILFRAVMAISWSIELRKMSMSNWGVTIVLGGLGVLFATFLILNPILGGSTMVVWTSMAFFCIGIYQIVLSFQLKKFHKNYTILKKITSRYQK